MWDDHNQGSFSDFTLKLLKTSGLKVTTDSNYNMENNLKLFLNVFKKILLAFFVRYNV